MILDKVLLLKGLGGVAACGGLAYGGTVLVKHYISNANDQTLVDLISKVGLDCKTPSATGTECTKVTTPADKKINVKQNNETTGKFEIDTITGGKIKLYKLEGDNTGYNKGLKFVIEDGDITKDSNKLEKFETYEIEEVEESGTKKYYLKRKFTKSEAIKNDLGLPAKDNECVLPTETTTNKTCTLDATKLKAINFEGKGTTEPTIDSGGSATLTISKETTDTDIFTDGYKFSLQATGGTVTITTKTKTITIPTNKSVEFKINKEGSSLSLEKAWDITKWGQKVGLTCPAAGSTNECTLPTTNTLKLYNGANDKTESGQVSDNTKKLKYEENVADHNQGFKFFAEQEITLSGNDSKKIAGSTATYEIKEHTESNSKTWYLTKKTTSGGAG